MRIEACRICANEQLLTIGSLGEIAVSDFTDTPQQGTKYPLELVYCEKCTLLQLAHNTPRELLYKDYWYQSGLNPMIIADLKSIATHVQTPCVDIGANDGTLLKHVSGDGLKYAVDPSNIKPNGFYWQQDYWENDTVQFIHKMQTITAIACLYDLPDPNKFVQKVKNYLAPTGTFITQLMTLEPMIENNDVGNICHEHLEFYSYKSLVVLFEQNGLEIYKVEKNKMNGGSYRIFARHLEKGSVTFKEKEYGVQELKEFFKRIEQNKKDSLDFLHQINKEGKILRGYGASTKANTILQYYGIKGGEIIDINPNKVGKYTIASNNVIINEIPDYCDYLWVFPYGFIDYFKKKEKNYKGKWITSIPKFTIL